MSMLRKTTNAIVFFLFIGFAIVQYNDSDAFKWIALYLAVAILPVLTILKIKSKLYNFFLLGLFFAILILTYSNLTSWVEAGKPKFIDYEPTHIKEVEGIREYLGAFICFLTSLIYLLIKKRP